MSLSATVRVQETSAPDAPAWPPIVASIDPDQAIARINIWRADDREFAARLLAGEWASVALRRMALARWGSGQPGLASVMLATAAAIEPDGAQIWAELGSTLQAADDPAQASLAFQQSLARDSAPARVWLALGLAANALNDFELAERAFRAALNRDVSLADAAFGLGLSTFARRDYAAAEQAFRKALALGVTAPLARVGLGQSLFFLGKFPAAAAELRIAIDMGASPDLIRRAALSAYLAAACEMDFGRAKDAYERIAGEHAESLEKTAFAAFQILRGYDRIDVALALAKAHLPGRDADPVQRYLIQAAAGEACDCAPQDYVIAHFDRFADDFDRQLVDVLGYRAPADLLELVGPAAQSAKRVLDLGCGTGLAGPLLQPGRDRLVGVDLSPRMLEKAAARSVYDDLIEAEMVDYLKTADERFDLIFAADALIYFGDLKPVFAAAARVTGPGALLAFNIETVEDGRFGLQPSGRFAHDPAILPEIAAPWFRVRRLRRAALRREGLTEIFGAFVVLERRGGLALKTAFATSTLAA